MRLVDDTLVLSPSDLTGAVACAHLTRLERLAARGELSRPERSDPVVDVLSRRGAEHEQRQLLGLAAEAGKRVVTISGAKKTRADLTALAAATERAMRDAADLIYQAAFFDGCWQGQADFLERVDRASDLGGWSYEVSDAKLARSVRATAVLQLSAYTEYVTRIQQREPENFAVLTGDGLRHTFRVRDYSAYYRGVKRRLEQVALAPPSEALETYPEPVEHCSICRWAERCESQRREDDHLSLVAHGYAPLRRLCLGSDRSCGEHAASIALRPSTCWARPLGSRPTIGKIKLGFFWSRRRECREPPLRPDQHLGAPPLPPR